ncbi:MAG: glycosyltransferase family 4 protein [Leptospirillia bacterium]
MPEPTPEPLSIAMLSSWWRDPERGSGTAVGITGLAGGLSALGHQVTSLAPRTASAHLGARLIYNLEIPGRIARGNFDLVVGIDWDGVFCPAGHPGHVANIKGVSADECRFERGLPRLWLWLQSHLERLHARRAPMVVTSSKYSRDCCIDDYGVSPERIMRVPEGIDFAHWNTPQFDPGERPPTILSVARQYPRKNTATLLFALPRVIEQVPNARLRVVGDGPRLRHLKQLAQRLGVADRVAFLGAVKHHEDVRREYLNARVFCLPTRQEGFGIAFLEAMASGLPVVAADAGAVPEVVPHGQAGLLVDPDDPEALADALVHLLTNAPLAARLGTRGRRIARTHDWRNVAARFLDVVC